MKSRWTFDGTCVVFSHLRGRSRSGEESKCRGACLTRSGRRGITGRGRAVRDGGDDPMVEELSLRGRCERSGSRRILIGRRIAVRDGGDDPMEEEELSLRRRCGRSGSIEGAGLRRPTSN